MKSRFPHQPRHGAQPPSARRRAGRSEPRNFDSLRDIIQRSHEEEAPRNACSPRPPSSSLALSLRIIRMRRDTRSDYLWAVVADDLQWDFSLHQALSLYLVETIGSLTRIPRTYVPDLITLVESILENPEAVLRKQVDKLKGELVAKLKGGGCGV